MRGFRYKFWSRAIRRHAAAARYWVSRDGRSVAGTPAADGGRQVVNAVLLNNIDHRDLRVDARRGARFGDRVMSRSEEHTSELQSLMRISYAVFCLKKKK